MLVVPAAHLCCTSCWKNFASYIYARLSKKEKSSSYLPLVWANVATPSQSWPTSKQARPCAQGGALAQTSDTPRVLNEAAAFSFSPFPLDNLVFSPTAPQSLLPHTPLGEGEKVFLWRSAQFHGRVEETASSLSITLVVEVVHRVLVAAARVAATPRARRARPGRVPSTPASLWLLLRGRGRGGGRGGLAVVVVVVLLLLQGRRPAAAGRRVHAQECRHGRVVAVAL